MIEFMLATAILVGKAQIAPDKVQYDFINDNQPSEGIWYIKNSLENRS